MTPQRAALIAIAGSLTGVLAGLDSLFPIGLSSALCENAQSCAVVTETLLVAAPLSAWILGLFAGLLWSSIALWRKRDGYLSSGGAIALLGGATAILFLSQLPDSDGGAVLQLCIAAASLVALGGFLARDASNPSSRAFGATAVCLTAALLTHGTLSQANALHAPWTVHDQAPKLTGFEPVLRGSVSAQNHVVFYGDLSDAAARNVLNSMGRLATDTFKLTVVPLATTRGEDLAVGLTCATKSGLGDKYTLSLLRTPTKNPMDLAIATRLSPSEFAACTENPAIATGLRENLSRDQDYGITTPYSILLKTSAGWYQLSHSQPAMIQINKLVAQNTQEL